MFGLIFVILAFIAFGSIAAASNWEEERRRKRQKEMLSHPKDPSRLTYINNRGYMALTENGHPCAWEKNGRFLKDLKTGLYVYDKYAGIDRVYIKFYKAKLLHGKDNAYWWWYNPCDSTKRVNLIHNGDMYLTELNKYGGEYGYISERISTKLIMPAGINAKQTKEKAKEWMIKQNNIIMENEKKYAYLTKEEKFTLNKRFHFVAEPCTGCDDRSNCPNLYDVDTYEGLFEGDDIYE